MVEGQRMVKDYLTTIKNKTCLIRNLPRREEQGI